MKANGRARVFEREVMTSPPVHWKDATETRVQHLVRFRSGPSYRKKMLLHYRESDSRSAQWQR